MSKRLKHKVAIITGATSGMGKAIAELFHKEGAHVVLSGRDVERGLALGKKLKNSLFVATDVSVQEENERLVQKTMAHFGKIDILSLNAGILGLGNVVQLSNMDWHKTIDTNLSSIYYICKFALPHLVLTKGTILVNASIAAFKSFPNHPAYCASKAGAVALMKQMAVEYGPNIRVNAICPGPVDTPLLHNSAKAFEDSGKAIDNAKNATLLKRLGTPEEVARLALFLVSGEASWITGTTMTIDGGIMNTQAS